MKRTAARDTLHSAQTPEGIAFTLRPAGTISRFCAYLIDGLIGGSVFVMLAILLNSLSSITGSWIFLLISFVYTWFYHSIFELFMNGQSPGKRLLGLRVVMADGSPVAPGASFLRNILRFADTFLQLHLIALMVISASPGFRRLGDWAAGTLVVYTQVEAPPLNRTAMPWLDAYRINLQIPRLSFEERQTILDFARRYPELGRERAEELAAIFAPELRKHIPGSSRDCPGNADLLLSAAAGIIGEGS